MKFYKNIKKKYDEKFNTLRKKAALKLSLGIIFFTLATLFLAFSKDYSAVDIIDENIYSYATTLQLLEDKKDVYESLKTYIKNYNYTYSYSDTIDNCVGKFFNANIYYIECGDTGYYNDGEKIIYYDKDKNPIESTQLITIPDYFFYNIETINAVKHNEIITNFDNSKTYNYIINKDNIDITFYNQDLLKIKHNNLEYFYKDYGKITKEDILENFE